jgi:hypothetical protein
VHLLIALRATHRLADVLRELKAISSLWVQNEIGIRNFAWQEGYGAFTVSASQREAVRRYVGQQADHHRTRTLREEYLELASVAAQNSMNDMFDPTPMLGLPVFRSVHRWLHHRLMSKIRDV